MVLAILPVLLLGCKGAEGSGSSASSVGDSSVSEPPALDVKTIRIPVAISTSISSGEIKTKEYVWFDFLPSTSRPYNFLIQFQKLPGSHDVVAEEFPEPFSGCGGVATAEYRKNYRGYFNYDHTYFLIVFSKQLNAGEHFYLRLRGENFWRTIYSLYIFDDLSNALLHFEHISHEYGSYSWKNYTSHRATCSECGHVDEQPHFVASDATPDRWGYYRCLLCGGRAKFGFIQEGVPAVVGASENGSVELESGIKVVVDDDLDALRDGALEFRPVAQGGHDAE